MSALASYLSPSRGMRYAEVASLGLIEEEILPSGTIRYRIDLGRVDGQRQRLSGFPGDLRHAPIPFATHEQAESALGTIRGELSGGMSMRQIVARWTNTESLEHQVEACVARYIDQYRALVDQSKRSPTSLREVERYARTDGHFSWWWGRSIYGLQNGDADDFQVWLGKRGIGLKTQKNVSDAFRAFLRWQHRRDNQVTVPSFATIAVPRYAPRTIDLEAQSRVLEAIPWERRGLFLAGAYEAFRLGELRAFDLDDFETPDRIRIAHAIQGPRLNAPRAHTKNRSAEWRQMWHPDLVRWCQWRLEQATPEARIRGEVALFWNPKARNHEKRWTPDPAERQWARACEVAGVSIPFQQGTRHSILTVLGSSMPERMLQAFSRHRDSRSLDHYANPKPTPDQIRNVVPGPWGGGK